MRLTAELWEQARAEYEVRGVSLGEVAKRFCVATSSVSRRARTEGWTQGKMQDLATRKVAAVKELAEVETQTQELPLRFQHTLQSVVQERLQAEGLLASLDVALAVKGAALVHAVDSPEQWETMTRGRRNLIPAGEKTPQTTVNVSQASASVISPEPVESLRRALRGDFEGD